MKAEQDPRWKFDIAHVNTELIIKHAYAVIYVEGMLRAEKEGISFEQAIECELADRGMLTIATGILDFERMRNVIRKGQPQPVQGETD